ncbi:ABC1 kinase family protein [Ketobacter sp.]|uniref:ABC1 kinase family protein n=1 Tax=Ketobacter sp. TaxID=2083498 RepID=UPI000F102A40|nr:AarF/UbiB family protein [Ketobacter sp.]RLT95088.1 MAG: AarF/ABC1/UbiB kinase family protein [Ketobacter sp.]
MTKFLITLLGVARCLRAVVVFSVMGLDYWLFPRSRTLDARNARRLEWLLRRNGGTWIKAGQFLSARPDLLKAPYIERLVPLQYQVEPERDAHVYSVLKRVYGDAWYARFEEFHHTPVAGASIAVVYRARLLDGREVALKIKRKHIDHLFAVDLAFYRLIARVASRLSGKFDLVGAVDAFLRSLSRELDFVQEAQNVKTFGALPHLPGVRIPALIEECCNDQVVALEWMEAMPIVSYLESASASEQERLITLLQNSYIQQIVRFGLMQGDPHPGNFMVTAAGELVLLDFGLLAPLTDAERVSYVNIMLAIIEGDVAAFARALERAGVTNLPVSAFSGKLVNVLASVSMSGAFQLSNDELEALLLDLYRMLNQHAVYIPDHFLLTGRVLIALTGLIRRYGCAPQPIQIKQILFDV